MTHQDYMESAWNRALSVLKPSTAELERGLELHYALGVCDNYGFLPKAVTPGLAEAMNGMQDRGIGLVEWKQKSWCHRVTASTRDFAGATEFFAALEKAGVGGLIQNVSDVGESLEYAVMNIAAHRHLCNVFKDRLFQATCAEDLEADGRGGKLGVLFSLTGLPLAGSMADPDGVLDWVDVWYQMGVRLMHLGYNRRNYMADGCTEERDGGLSDFGRELVRRMNLAGIIVDVPHSSQNTTFDAISCSSKPIIATHAGCFGIHAHPRCKSDKEIKAIADSGGVLGIFAVPSLLGPNADIALLMHHLRYAVKLVGAEHVAIGTDLGYQRPWPDEIRPFRAAGQLAQKVGGWKPVHQTYASAEHQGGSLTWTNWPLFTVGLLQLGLSESDVAAILGRNLHRVLRACRPAEELEASAGQSEIRRNHEAFTQSRNQ